MLRPRGVQPQRPWQQQRQSTPQWQQSHGASSSARRPNVVHQHGYHEDYNAAAATAWPATSATPMLDNYKRKSMHEQSWAPTVSTASSAPAASSSKPPQHVPRVVKASDMKASIEQWKEERKPVAREVSVDESLSMGVTPAVGHQPQWAQFDKQNPDSLDLYKRKITNGEIVWARNGPKNPHVAVHIGIPKDIKSTLSKEKESSQAASLRLSDDLGVAAPHSALQAQNEALQAEIEALQAMKEYRQAEAKGQPNNGWIAPTADTFKVREPTKTVYVKGYDWETTEDELHLHMCTAGLIEKLEMFKMGAKGAHAKVTYAERHETEWAVANLHGTVVVGDFRYLEIKEDRPGAAFAKIDRSQVVIPECPEGVKKKRRKGEPEPAPEPEEQPKKTLEELAALTSVDLPRRFLTKQDEQVLGEVFEWEGDHGWIKPVDGVKHPTAVSQGGFAYVKIQDCAEELQAGRMCGFRGFTSAKHYGAADVILV